MHRINDPYSGLQTGKLVFLPIEVGRIGNPSWIGINRINDPRSGLQTDKLVFLPIEVGRIGNPSWIGINRINNPRSDMLIGVFRMQSKEAGSVS